MWTKLDDQLLGHRKILIAGEAIGRNGVPLATAMYTAALMWTNRQLTDGVIPLAAIKTFGFHDPIVVAEALVEAALWEKLAAAYRIHDFHEFNPPAADVREHRQHVSAARAKAGTNGARVRWQRHK